MPAHLNEDYDWDAFDSQDYFAHNYASMRTDDATMLAMVREWFATALSDGGPPLEGIDVGSGANLYPALALLPYCDAITLYEYSKENVEWLQTAVHDLPSEWEPFWRHMTPGAGAPAEDFAAVRRRVRKVCAVTQGSIFELERARWQLGTMFFVAESLTEDRVQFDEALGCFLGALRPGAPFAAAFMENSKGYDVGEIHYPACSLTEEQLTKSIDSLDLVGKLEVHHVDIDPAPLRPGYTGYLVAIGNVKD
ncbi:MAG TPA: SCO2525 family SAM-dependent methyltransferase [Actinospica sp.]|nr:SCO2525 family SAM-dependent methyltransferase [Actinospica sp.]